MKLCQYCKETLQEGEACIPEEYRKDHYHFYHPECHFIFKDNERERHLHQIAEAARTVN